MESADKLRDFIDDTFMVNSKTYERGMEIADAIEDEVIEKFLPFPSDAKGKPIHVGDVVRDDEGGIYRVCDLMVFKWGWRVNAPGCDRDGNPCELHAMPETVTVAELRTLTDILCDLFDRKMTVTDAEHAIAELKAVGEWE